MSLPHHFIAVFLSFANRTVQTFFVGRRTRIRASMHHHHCFISVPDSRDSFVYFGARVRIIDERATWEYHSIQSQKMGAGDRRV